MVSVEIQFRQRSVPNMYSYQLTHCVTINQSFLMILRRYICNILQEEKLQGFVFWVAFDSISWCAFCSTICRQLVSSSLLASSVLPVPPTCTLPRYCRQLKEKSWDYNSKAWPLTLTWELIGEWGWLQVTYLPIPYLTFPHFSYSLTPILTSLPPSSKPIIKLLF